MRRLISRLRHPAPQSWICRSCQQRRSISATSNISGKLPDTPARTRFAPSPTGYLHLGSLRTALFNYLLARATGGQFLLRIEDTDQKRTVADAEDRLFQDLEWAGIEWDEGPKAGGEYGPYRQSERTYIYREHANTLLESGHAYRCFCTPNRLHALAEHRSLLGLPVDYDRHCTHVAREESEDRAAKGEAHVVRLKIPDRYPEVHDIVYGRVKSGVNRSNKALLHPGFEDPILLKTDGFPTYHLANVVDDHLMKITHVVRGSEWMSSTPKHLAMYQAFGWKPPQFAHVGLLVDKDHQKLSKRKQDIDVSSYRDKLGILPEALTNYVALLGWSHTRSTDIMSLSELVENFSMKFTKGETVVTEQKLTYLQKAHAERYVKSDAPEVQLIKDAVEKHLKSDTCVVSTDQIQDRVLETYIEAILKADNRNYFQASQFVERNRAFFERPSKEERLTKVPKLTDHCIPGSSVLLTGSLTTVSSDIAALGELLPEDWTIPNLMQIEQDVMDKNTTETMKTMTDVDEPDTVQKGVRKSWSTLVHTYVRWALMAGNPGPGGASTMAILGREETLQRLRDAAECLESVEVAEKVI